MAWGSRKTLEGEREQRSCRRPHHAVLWLPKSALTRSCGELRSLKTALRGHKKRRTLRRRWREKRPDVAARGQGKREQLLGLLRKQQEGEAKTEAPTARPPRARRQRLKTQRRRHRR